MGRPLALTGLVCAAVALGAGVATAVQTKFGFWWNLAGPKMDRLFSGGRLKQMFNKEALPEPGPDRGQVCGSRAATLWVGLRDEFVTLPRMLQLGPDELLAAMFGPLARRAGQGRDGAGDHRWRGLCSDAERGSPDD